MNFVRAAIQPIFKTTATLAIVTSCCTSVLTIMPQLTAVASVQNASYKDGQAPGRTHGQCHLVFELGLLISGYYEAFSPVIESQSSLY
ncbi:hypothetical protein [Leptolyngbya sp. FACHB-711]|uniref:hypothetical protein n=1 Tax=Leptolyngbya sp. FACHB-711 TaxID=2692813 RepID=UPI001686C267|nr:hypothetical protein [Leptolyngbya sp. FACHB-711]MBD2028204.1 hypothetical protein [Leptolyngbya sp. FACHB-711]